MDTPSSMTVRRTGGGILLLQKALGDKGQRVGTTGLKIVLGLE